MHPFLLGMSPTFNGPPDTQRHAMQDSDVIFNHGSGTDHNANPVIDKNALTDFGFRRN